MTVSMSKPVILTGLRANSEFHLGNYLGAILPMVELQKQHAGEYQVNMFIPDLHSFTTPIDHGQLYQQTLDNLRLFVAAGLDTNNSDTYIYRQSYIPAHSELTWILDCFIYMGELIRMTQFKDKAGIQLGRTDSMPDVRAYKAKKTEISPDEWIAALEDFERFLKESNQFKARNKRAEESVSAGLFNYPALMAADILLYGAEWVPVGDDQKQHLELTRDVAMRMNNKFGELFTVPHEWNKQLEFASRDNGVRVRSLRNPDKKMSKSVGDPAGTIMLSDKPEDAAQKVMSATTDSVGMVHLDWDNQPGVANLLQISALLAKRPLNDVAAEWEGKTSYGELKQHVAEQVSAFLTDIHAKYAGVDENSLRTKLEQDEEAMRQVANQTLYKVQQAVGLRPKS